jgi:hypothetical protein
LQQLIALGFVVESCQPDGRLVYQLDPSARRAARARTSRHRRRHD